jgi:hypothetical protein
VCQKRKERELTNGETERMRERQSIWSIKYQQISINT